MLVSSDYVTSVELDTPQIINCETSVGFQGVSEYCMKC